MIISPHHIVIILIQGLLYDLQKHDTLWHFMLCLSINYYRNGARHNNNIPLALIITILALPNLPKF